jgi:TonB family protein
MLALTSSVLAVPVSNDVTVSTVAVPEAVQSTQAPAQSSAATSSQHVFEFKSDKAGLPSSVLVKTPTLLTSTVTLTVPPAQSASAKTNNDGVKDSATLDSRPQLLSDVVIEYPLTANNREGIVTLELTLAIGGKVDYVEVLKATPPGFFESAAIKGFQNAQFTPGLFQGLGVKARLVVEVEFMPTNRGGLVAGPK